MKRTALDKKLEEALSSLESVKQKILECRFGLGAAALYQNKHLAFEGMSYESLAEFLSQTTSPEVVLQFASNHKEADDQVEFSADDVRFLEAEALRDLSRPCRQRKSPDGSIRESEPLSEETFINAEVLQIETVDSGCPDPSLPQTPPVPKKIKKGRAAL